MSDPKGYNDMYIDSLNFFVNEPNKSTTYEKLYAHLKCIGYELTVHEGAQIKYLDENVLKIFNSITAKNLKSEYFGTLDHPEDQAYKIFISNGGYDKIKTIVTREYPMSEWAQQQLELRIQHEKEFAEKMQIEIEKAESKRREKEGFKLTKNGYIAALVSIIAGCVIGLGQIGISIYDIWWRDNQHETRMIELDFKQVEQNNKMIKQNKKIIELLQSNKQKDTVIVNVQIPSKNK